jgi:hypothetical protein
MFARNHSPLLLQISSTNALESYHRDIKIHCNQKDGFRASFAALHEVFARKISKEDRSVWEQQSKTVAETRQYPELARFPYMFQTLIISELNVAMELLLSNDRPIPIPQDYAKCHCMFYKKYLLPCRHMFLLDMTHVNGWFTKEIWEKYEFNGEEIGFDFYSSFERQDIPALESVVQNDKDILAFHSIMDRFRDQFWRIKERGNDEEMSRYLQLMSCTARSTQHR